LISELPRNGLLGNLAFIRPHTYMVPGRMEAYR